MQHFDNEIPGIGTQKSDTAFSFAGPETKDGAALEKISSTTELTFEPADNPRGDLEITDQEGTAIFYFDPKAGHMIRSEGSQKTSIELSGQQELTQEIKETSSMRLGKSPDAKTDTGTSEPAKTPAN